MLSALLVVDVRFTCFDFVVGLWCLLVDFICLMVLVVWFELLFSVCL